MEDSNKTEMIIFRCTKALAAKVKRYAEQDHESQAEFVRKAVEKHVDDRRGFHGIRNEEVRSELSGASECKI